MSRRMMFVVGLGLLAVLGAACAEPATEQTIPSVAAIELTPSPPATSAPPSTAPAAPPAPTATPPAGPVAVTPTEAPVTRPEPTPRVQLPASDPAAIGSELGLDGLIELLRTDPDAAGDRGEDLVKELERVRDRPEAKRVDRARRRIAEWRDDGRLDGEVAAAALAVLDQVAHDEASAVRSADDRDDVGDGAAVGDDPDDEDDD